MTVASPPAVQIKPRTEPLPKPTPLSKSPLGASGISLPNAKANPSAGGTVPPPTRILKRAVKPKTGRPASAELVTINAPAAAGTPMPAELVAPNVVFMMLNAHATWAATQKPMHFGVNDLVIPLVILFGWIGTYHIYEHSKKVTGF